jgi:hypothetical protein
MKDSKPERWDIRVTWSNGDTTRTEINGSIDEIRAYYLGKTFNIGTVEDKMVKAVAVKFLTSL